jgi:GTPase Era involved in 16S rRNA processing
MNFLKRQPLGSCRSASGRGQPGPYLAQFGGNFSFFGGGGVSPAASQREEKHKENQGQGGADQDRTRHLESLLGLYLGQFLSALGIFDRALGVCIRRAMEAILVVKVDRLLLVGQRALTEVVALGEEVGLQWKEIVPLSSVSRHNIETVTELLIAALPVGPKLYPDDDISDQELEITVAELIREAALDGVQEELPHSIAVVVEEIKVREGRPADRPLTDVRAEIYVERPTQKAIVIGAKGSRLKTVGTRARKEIEVLLGTPIFLDLHVRVAKDWQKDPKQLRRLGF